MPIIVLAFVAIFGLSVASDGSKPGDILFPLETLVEEVQALGTADNSSKANLRTKFAAERVKEVQDLIASGKAQGLATAILNLETNFSKAIDELKAMRKAGTINKETFQAVKKALQEQRQALKKIQEGALTDADDDTLLEDADDFLEIEENRLEALEEAKEEAADKLREAAEDAVKEASESAQKRPSDETDKSREEQTKLFIEQADDLKDEADEVEDEGSSTSSGSDSSGSNSGSGSGR